MVHRPFVRFLVVVGLVLASCGGDGGADSGALDGSDPAVVRVGAEHEHQTIQSAVDEARPGDLVLIDPGIYRETVKVDTERLVVRGIDRNTVVLDGGGELLNGVEVTSDRVAIENLTVRNYSVNGVLFAAPAGSGAPQDGPVGWRASYVTTANNGLYGLYAFGTGPGQFDHNYASGHPDSGIYVGQCKACGAVIINNVAERNAIGFENTNASGVIVAGNVFRRNRIGVAFNSAVGEELAPQDGGKLVSNLIVDNDDPDTPETRGGFGVGIAVAGGTGNEISGNVVTGHSGAGIVLVDQDGFAPTDNKIERNTVDDNAVDLLVAAADGSVPDTTGTCFADNGSATTRPADLEILLACGRPGAVLPASGLELADGPEGVPVTDIALPVDQPGRPGDELEWSAPPARPDAPDLDDIAVPAP